MREGVCEGVESAAIVLLQTLGLWFQGLAAVTLASTSGALRWIGRRRLRLSTAATSARPICASRRWSEDN
jgi:hypothetical protein